MVPSGRHSISYQFHFYNVISFSDFQRGGPLIMNEMSKPLKILIFILLCLGVFLWLLPLLVAVITSFRTNGDFGGDREGVWIEGISTIATALLDLLNFFSDFNQFVLSFTKYNICSV